ncbi:MAG: dUTP diphosphatase [Candidatus Obscuribacterales bacterium]|jgi:dUTP pyrophosphatase
MIGPVGKVTLKVKRLPHCKAMPKYATSGSAGLDLTNALAEAVTLQPGERCRIPIGIIVEIPPGYEGQVRPRSGLADKAGISLTNCVGTIDSDYRGEVQVLVVNHGQKPYTFEPGERIAQLLVTPVPEVEVVEVEELSDSAERGAGGFGSTGRLSESKEVLV